MSADQLRKLESDSITLGDQRHALDVLAQSIQGLWEVVNNLTRLRPTRRLQFRVTIFGSAPARAITGSIPGHTGGNCILGIRALPDPRLGVGGLSMGPA